jgi:hypothetical protein
MSFVGVLNQTVRVAIDGPGQSAWKFAQIASAKVRLCRINGNERSRWRASG